MPAWTFQYSDVVGRGTGPRGGLRDGGRDPKPACAAKNSARPDAGRWCMRPLEMTMLPAPSSIATAGPNATPRMNRHARPSHLASRAASAIRAEWRSTRPVRHPGPGLKSLPVTARRSRARIRRRRSAPGCRRIGAALPRPVRGQRPRDGRTAAPHRGVAARDAHEARGRPHNRDQAPVDDRHPGHDPRSVILPALGQPSNDIGLRDRQRSTIGINRPQQIGELQQCARHEPSQPRRGCERGTSPQHPKSAARCKAAK
jgi:hypothetical protein